MVRQCVGCKVEGLPPPRDTEGDVLCVNPLSSESGNHALFVVSPNRNVNSQSPYSLWRRANARNAISQPQHILYFIQMALSFYLVVWQSWMLTTVLILKNRKTSYFISLFIYFNPEKQALQLKGILLKRFYWSFALHDISLDNIFAAISCFNEH